MSDENGTPDTSAGSPTSPGSPTGRAAGTPAAGTGPGIGPGAGPRPEPLRFFGTTWVDHDPGLRGYAVRRVAAAAGSLAAAAVSCLVLRLAYQGIAIADLGGFVTLLVVVMFAVCSALAFRHTWEGFAKRPDPDRQASLRGLLAIGFVGSLLAYFFRTLTEAPGESLHRKELEEARRRHTQRATRRTGNPSKKRRNN
ncbi:EamA/RhaT family transporter [Streptomyces rishiriensis]|uniref:EamA/RhaT family transporter n=1 Tax=Streptomyces rishiriensis TaxID=68264 RepID=UPI00378AE223